MNNRQNNDQALINKDEFAIKEALNKHLDAEVNSLDFNVTSRLAAARHTALSNHQAKPLWQQMIGWRSVAGLAATIAVAYVIGSQLLVTSTMQPTPQTTEIATGELMEDLTILAEGDDIEFYQSIEFLEWLETNS